MDHWATYKLFQRPSPRKPTLGGKGGEASLLWVLAARGVGSSQTRENKFFMLWIRPPQCFGNQDLCSFVRNSVLFSEFQQRGKMLDWMMNDKVILKL